MRDRYTIALLNALTYTENCYNCHYARTERVSDITLGDSWRMELDQGEQKKGISQVLCQTEKKQWLLRNAEVCIFDADLKRAVSNNHQLSNPSVKPSGWGRFFKKLSPNGTLFSAIS